MPSVIVCPLWYNIAIIWFGALSFGKFSFGQFTFGTFSFGKFSFSQFSFGVFLFGQFSFGQFLFSQLPFGEFSFGKFYFGLFLRHPVVSESLNPTLNLLNRSDERVSVRAVSLNRLTASHLNLRKTDSNSSGEDYMGRKIKANKIRSTIDIQPQKVYQLAFATRIVLKP